jgi:hypothetical protein
VAQGFCHTVYERREREIVELKLHPPRFDLREVEDIIDESKQVPARAEHAVKRLHVLLQCLCILAQHMRTVRCYLILVRKQHR